VLLPYEPLKLHTCCCCEEEEEKKLGVSVYYANFLLGD
jgi:hypothetical protein